MSYDSELAGMMALAIGMITGDASEGLEAVQNAEQCRARSACRLPKQMKPSKEAFENLGFTFQDIDDDVLYQATLPEGWKLESDGDYWTTLVDEKGRKRGSYFYKGDFYDRKGSMYLSIRFRVTCDSADAKRRKAPFTISVKDADDTIIFIAGKCKDSFSEERDELTVEAERYLNTNYPEWKDPTKFHPLSNLCFQLGNLIVVVDFVVWL